jgi:GNAT superfamily N-acetyltransferase
MICLEGLATHPDHQGKGYGGTILDTIASFADTQDRAIYLLSSNNANTFFYESHGFDTAVEIVLGDNDPTWDKKPFIIKIVSVRNLIFVQTIRRLVNFLP